MTQIQDLYDQLHTFLSRVAELFTQQQAKIEGLVDKITVLQLKNDELEKECERLDSVKVSD